MHKHAATRLLLSAFCILLIISCSSPTPEAIPPTETPVIPTETASPTDSPLPTETPTEPPLLQPALERPQYAIDLQLNYSTKAATVNQTITYPNWTGETLDRLVLAVQPNLWNGGFSLKSLAVDELPITNYVLENLNQRLEIPLPQPLQPGGTVVITMTYGLILPQMQAKAQTIIAAQRSRGLDTESTFLKRVGAVVPLVGPLVFGSLVEVEERAIAIEARGFTSTRVKTSLHNVLDTNTDKILRWMLAAFVLLSLALRIWLS